MVFHVSNTQGKAWGFQHLLGEPGEHYCIEKSCYCAFKIGNFCINGNEMSCLFIGLCRLKHESTDFMQ